MPPDVDELVARRMRDLPRGSTATETDVRASVERELVDDLADKPALGAYRDRIRLRSASTVPRDRVTWVWDGRIPAGMGTLIAGREGMGKTALVGHLLARLTRGELAGAWEGRPAHVVYIGAEDDPSTVLVPRLIAAGADLERVHLLDAPAMFSASDAPALAKRLVHLDDVAAVVLDPLDAHLGDGIDTHRKAEVQRAFAGLVEELTARHSCGVVGIAHLSKGDSVDVLRRIVGSVGFTTSARSVLAVGEHPDDPRDRVCVTRKANMADPAESPALRYRVEGADVDHPDGGEPIRTARVVLLGEEHGIDPDAILAVPSSVERTERDDAADWLRDLLGEGEPLPYREVERLAGEAGISRATLHRARSIACVVVERDDSARGRPSSWRLVVSSQSQRGGIETKSERPLTCGDEAAIGVSSHVSGAGDAETIDDGALCSSEDYDAVADLVAGALDEVAS